MYVHEWTFTMFASFENLKYKTITLINIYNKFKLMMFTI